MEAFDFAVGLGPEGPGAAMGRPGGSQGLGPDPGAVAGPVVGEDFLDGDAEGGEVPAGAPPEPRGGDGAFASQGVTVSTRSPRMLKIRLAFSHCSEAGS